MSSNDLPSSLRSIRQDLCAIAGMTRLDWAISLMGWAGETRLVQSLSVVCAGFESELGEKGNARVYLSTGVVGDMPVAWYWESEARLGIHGPFETKDKAIVDAMSIGCTEVG